MDENTHFWTIIDIEETRLPELKRLEYLLNDLQQPPFNEDKLLNNTDALIRILENLGKNSYQLFRKIDLEKRQKLIECISQKWKQLKKILKQILPPDTWQILHNHAQTFTKLCSFNFQMKPLMFAKQALAYHHLPRKLEGELMDLIDGMRKKYPSVLHDILQEEYREIRTHQREKIVITVLGSTKASKSSLINFLLEDEICPTGNQAATARLTKITYGQQIRLTLFSSTNHKLQTFVFNNTETLLEKAKEFIILKNEARKSKLCEDEVLIELPMEELQGVELWDVPGFDENLIINKRIHEILKETDLILAVLAQQECLRQTAIDFIKPCLKQDHQTKPVTKICFIISQIDKFKSDEQTKDSKEKFLQYIYEKICDELPTNFPKGDYQSSEQFIPMCSSPIHSLAHYLTCREEFLEKSCQWFNLALYRLTHHRTEILLKSIKEFSNYENLFHQQKRYENTKQIFNKQFLLFSQELTTKVNEKLNDIHVNMQQSIESIAIKSRDLFYQYENLENIEEYIQKQLAKKLKEILTIQNPEIIQMISVMSINFFDTIELKPPEIQILKQVLNETLNKDYYSHIIGQYQHTSPYHLSSYLSRLYQALSETLKATIVIPYGDFEKIKKAFGKFVRRDKYVEDKTMDSITDLVNEVLEILSVKLQQRTEKTFKDILTNQLNQIHQQLEKKVQKYLHSSLTDTKIDHLRQFSRDNASKIKRMHLDILDIQFNLDYQSNLEINLQERLDTNSTSPVFTGILGKNQSPIVAKLIAFKDFQLQEVLYIREIKHKNIIKYYGVKKANDDEYYLITKRLDCNLGTYLKAYSKTFHPLAIDQMIIQILKGLDYIHNQLELIHGNIKLENILVNQMKNRFLITDLRGIHRPSIERVTPPEFSSIDNLAMITEKYDIFLLGMVIKEIIRLAELEQPDDGLIVGWWNVAEKCSSQEPSARPSCKTLLAKRARYDTK